MANSPVVGYVPYFTKNGTAAASGYWIKGYVPGTTTPLTMYADSTTGTPLVKAQINSMGFPATSGGAIFAPHFAAKHDLWLFPTEAEANANDTTNATKVVSNGILIPGLTDTIKAFDTVSAMKADTSLVVGQYIRWIEHTSGYGPEGGSVGKVVAASSGTDDNGSYFDLSNGLQVQNLFPNGVSIMHFGARGNDVGVTDATTAMQAALDYAATLVNATEVIVPQGDFLLTDMVSIPINATLRGVGHRASRIRVTNDSFNMSAAGVFDFDRETEFRDLGIYFDQTDAVSRATLVQYPPAFNIDASSTQKDRITIRDVLLNGAWDGIHAPGNTGGNRYINCDMGCAGTACYIGAALDSVYLENFHVWPFGHNASYWSTGIGVGNRPVALEVDRCDDLNVASILAYKSRIDLNGGFGSLVNVSLDADYASLYVAGGEWNCSSLYKTTNAGSDDGIAVTGGSLRVVSFNLEKGTAITGNYGSLCYVTGGELIMSSGRLKTYGGGNVFKAAGSQTVMMISGIGCDDSMESTNLTDGLVYISATTDDSQITVTDFNLPPKGGAVSGYFAVIDPAASANIAIFDNDVNGWSVDYNGINNCFRNNRNMVTAEKVDDAGFVAATEITRKLTGTADGAGALTIAIGSSVATAVTNGQIVALGCFEVSGSSLVPITADSISTTQISFSGLTAGADVVVFLRYL